jgi:hypothetical protein
MDARNARGLLHRELPRATLDSRRPAASFVACGGYNGTATTSPTEKPLGTPDAFLARIQYV